MSYGKSRLYDDGEVAAQQDLAAAPVPTRSNAPGSLCEAQREIDTLRSINAHLVRQVVRLRVSEAQAQRLADRDGLTGLYNRRKMHGLLDHAIADATLNELRVGLLFMDLDGFKEVNDEHGHGVGDRLLMAVASRIGGRTRTGDLVCRYGGDEFVVILPRVADTMSVLQVADSIARRVALPHRIDGIELRATAAIGVAIFPDQAESAAELMQLADASMYRAKAEWTDPALVSGASPPPARRRDDPSRSRMPT